MSSHVPSPASSPTSGAHNNLASPSASQDAAEQSFQSSNPDSSSFSLESSFQLESGYSNQLVDSERHPKGKRKRTTTQDKTTLEAAYNANPKPDKAARLDLVKRVTLNEKEVQIWFQNRRQNDRRKSRPLTPQEIADLRYGGVMHALSSDPGPFSNTSIVDACEETRSSEMDKRSPTPGFNAPQDCSQSSPEAISYAAEVPKEERRQSEPGLGTMPPSPSLNGEPGTEPPALSQSLPSSIGYLSNRWNTGNSFSTPSTLNQLGNDSLRLDSFPSSAPSTAKSSPASILPPPSTSSSQFRLSLSLEGKAEIAQASPPRPAQPQFLMDTATLPPVRAPRLLQRSHSALPGITLPPISALTAILPPQLSRGRSRDVHAWESCCEADTRDELTKLAESESSGSAIAAISLLRSSSQTTSLSNLIHGHVPGPNVLRPNSSKRNAPPSRRDSTKKPKLARASSSVARLQSLPPAPTNVILEKPEKVVEDFEPVKKAGLAIVLSPGGDSDKENWSPDEEGNPITRRRPLPSAGPAKTLTAAAGTARRLGHRVLGEQGTAKRQLLSSRTNTAPVPRTRGVKTVDASVLIFEDEGEQNDGGEGVAKKGKRSEEEVERFMRGEVSPSKKGDVDCVAGLLALSQGNWR
ncbi:homeobox transcription factor [Xylariales sp. AK1849]|nr:homeobox transcription factor [Xylariales sp. AK1849]